MVVAYSEIEQRAPSPVMAAFSRALKNTEFTELRAIPSAVIFSDNQKSEHDALEPLLKVADDTVGRLGDRLLRRLF